MSGVTLDHSYDNALRAATPYRNRIRSAQNVQALGRELYWGLGKIKYNADRDEGAILSILRLVAPENREKMRASLDPALKSVRRFADEQSERLQQTADQRAVELKARYR